MLYSQTSDNVSDDMFNPEHFEGDIYDPGLDSGSMAMFLSDGFYIPATDRY